MNNFISAEKSGYILVVDDEEDILELIRYNLEKKGFTVSCVVTGEQALKTVRTESPVLIVLDLMLPGIDGLDICRILKADPDTQSIPILMLTAKGEESDIILGLELGADDYVTKPFNISVLIARIQAILRRQKNTSDDKEVIVRNGLSVDPKRRDVKINNIRVELTYSEFQILHLLISHSGLVFTRNQIIDAVRGDNYFVTERSVDFQIVGLRKKLGAVGKDIETVRGVGYRFKEKSL